MESYFLDFANRAMIEQPNDACPAKVADPRTIARGPRRLRAALDRKYESNIPAGYTYFGQFVDHDVTFDPSSLRMRKRETAKLRNFRTPRLDLDSVYGRGPADQPYLFDQSQGQEGKLLVGRVRGTRMRDLPRNAQGRALVGDPRNDENAMVSQLHLAFLLAHNRLVDRARAKGLPHPFAFEEARRTLSWLYQYVVWNDFIRRMTSKSTHAHALRLVRTGAKSAHWELGFHRVYSWGRKPFMPWEFSAAAYRFGHSMVRNDYQTNARFRGKGRFAPLFAGSAARSADDLRGSRRMRSRNVIQWDWFLKMRSSRARDGFPQKARKIDTKLVNALAFLPGEREPMNVLAFRNLTRGVARGLPAGTAMARKYGLKPLTLKAGEPDALWYYILREAESLRGGSAGNRLGALGSLIVCATFAGLLKGDPDSYVNADPRWTPDKDELLLPGKDNRDGDRAGGRAGKRAWTLASIIRISGLPVSQRDFGARK